MTISDSEKEAASYHAERPALGSLPARLVGIPAESPQGRDTARHLSRPVEPEADQGNATRGEAGNQRHLPFLFTNLALGVVLAWVLTLSLRHGLGLGGLGAVIAVAANLVWVTGTALLSSLTTRTDSGSRYPSLSVRYSVRRSTSLARRYS
jgi:hypothetical protein